MKQKLTDDDYFKTAELPLAAALVCCGYSIDFLENLDPNRVLFAHRRKEGIDDIIQAFWQGKLPLDAKSYFFALRAVKSQIYQERGQNSNEG